MKALRHRIALGAGLGAALAGTLVLSLARAGDPAPEEEKAIDYEPIPAAEDKPKAPKPQEWQAAVRVKFNSRGPRAKNCKMYRVREWLKVHCEEKIVAASLLGGVFEGFFWLPQAKEGEPSPTSAEAMFPIKQGDRRILELFSFGPAYGGSMISPGIVLQEYWLPGEPAPVVVIR